jgi:transposase
MRSITAEKRGAIQALLEQGLSLREVASKVNVHYSTVSRIKNNIKNNGEFVKKHRHGRKRLLSEREDRIIAKIINSGEASNAVEAQDLFNKRFNLNLSINTIRRSLNRSGLVSRVKKKKPFLSEKHMKKRHEFAKKYQNWSVDDWRRVIFSDESKFNVFGSDGRQYCWVKPDSKLSPVRINPTIKHGGGKLFVWGCMTSKGVGYLCKIDNGLDGELYKQILSDELMETIKYYKIKKNNYIFQHDNDPKHTSKVAQEWLKINKIAVLEWPAQSPDLNPIEHLWSEVSKRIRKLEKKPSCVKDLWNSVQEVWESIEYDVIDKLYESMPNRIKAVLQAKGGYTKY